MRKSYRCFIVLCFLLYVAVSVICFSKAYSLYKVTPAGEGFWLMVNTIGCKVAFSFNIILYVILTLQSIRHLFGGAGWGWGVAWSILVFGPMKLWAIIPVVSYWVLSYYRREDQQYREKDCIRIMKYTIFFNFYKNTKI